MTYARTIPLFLGILLATGAAALAPAPAPAEADAARLIVEAVRAASPDPADLRALAQLVAAHQTGLTPEQEALVAQSGPVAPNHAQLVDEIERIKADARLAPARQGHLLAEAATRAQARALGVDLTDVALAGHATPSAALLALAERAHVALTEDEAAQQRRQRRRHRHRQHRRPLRRRRHRHADPSEPAEAPPAQPVPVQQVPILLPAPTDTRLVPAFDVGGNGHGHAEHEGPLVTLQSEAWAALLRQPMMVHGMIHEPGDVIYPHERVALFVDAANIETACRDLGWRPDYARVFSYFLGQGRYAAAYYFAPDYGDDNPARHTFLRHLCDLGFTIRQRRARRPKGERWIGTDLDAHLIMEMIEGAAHFDVAVLLSGDGDFEPVVRGLQQQGKRVYVASAHASPSHRLAFTAHKPLFHLDDFRDILERKTA